MAVALSVAIAVAIALAIARAVLSGVALSVALSLFLAGLAALLTRRLALASLAVIRRLCGRHEASLRAGALIRGRRRR
jgi:hypothetical protein